MCWILYMHPTSETPKCIEEKPIHLREEIDDNTIRIGDFKTPLSRMDILSRQNLQENVELAYLNQMYLTDIENFIQ